MASGGKFGSRSGARNDPAITNRARSGLLPDSLEPLGFKKVPMYIKGTFFYLPDSVGAAQI